MITDVFFLIGGTVIWIIGTLLNFLTYAIPDAFQTAIEQYIGYLAYAQGVLPIVPVPSMSGLVQTVGILTILGYGLTFITYWYMFKLVMWLIAHLPFIGKHVPHPHGGSHTSSQGHYRKDGTPLI